MVECFTGDQRAVCSSLTGITALCSCARHINPSLVLVQPRETRPDVTERWLTGMSNQTNKQTGTLANGEDPDEICHLRLHFICIGFVCSDNKQSSGTEMYHFINLLTGLQNT